MNKHELFMENARREFGLHKGAPVGNRNAAAMSSNEVDKIVAQYNEHVKAHNLSTDK